MSSYASVYGCGSSEAAHVCHSCPDGRIREFARVRSGGWVTEGYYATLLAGINDPAVWDAGIESGDIIMVPETAGTYDPGEPKELKGFADRKFSYGPRDMTLTLFDPDYYDNYAFYNEIINRTNLIPWFRTSGLVHLFDKTASIKAKDPVADDLEEEVLWQVDNRVTSSNLPSVHKIDTIASVFACPDF